MVDSGGSRSNGGDDVCLCGSLPVCCGAVAMVLLDAWRLIVESESCGSSHVIALAGDFVNSTWTSDIHGELGDRWCVA